MVKKSKPLKTKGEAVKSGDKKKPKTKKPGAFDKLSGFVKSTKESAMKHANVDALKEQATGAIKKAQQTVSNATTSKNEKSPTKQATSKTQDMGKKLTGMLKSAKDKGLEQLGDVNIKKATDAVKKAQSNVTKSDPAAMTRKIEKIVELKLEVMLEDKVDAILAEKLPQLFEAYQAEIAAQTEPELAPLTEPDDTLEEPDPLLETVHDVVEELDAETAEHNHSEDGIDEDFDPEFEAEFNATEDDDLDIDEGDEDEDVDEDFEDYDLFGDEDEPVDDDTKR